MVQQIALIAAIILCLPLMLMLAYATMVLVLSYIYFSIYVMTKGLNYMFPHNVFIVKLYSELREIKRVMFE